MPPLTRLSVVLIAVCLAGCSTGSSPDAAIPATDARAATARDVVAAFAEAGLPTPYPFDDSAQCAKLHCTTLIHTAAVSVYEWPDPAGAAAQAKTLGRKGFVLGKIVLEYNGEWPAEDHPKYEAALASARPVGSGS